MPDAVPLPADRAPGWSRARQWRFLGVTAGVGIAILIAVWVVAALRPAPPRRRGHRG